MKKFLKITAAILVLLLIFFVGAFKYRQYQANEISIPEKSNAIIKLSIDELYKAIGYNMVTNLGYYFKTDQKKTASKSATKHELGLKIPASIYFYTLADKPKTVLFTRLKIEDYTAFTNFIKNKLHFTIIKAQNLNLATNNLKNVNIFFNEEYAAISVSGEQGDFTATLKDILDQKNFIKLKESRFSELTASTDHLAFAGDKNNGAVNFYSGAIDFEGDFITNMLIPAAKPMHRKFNLNSAVSFWINASVNNKESKTYNLKNTSLERDSLLKHFKGYIDFEWISTTQQTDSIITYEYNDDFEKVEKVTLQKSDVPKAVLNISADANRLKTYLSNQNIIQIDSNIVNKAVFPLYKVFVADKNETLTFGTQKGLIVDATLLPADSFGELKINFLALNKQMKLPLFSKYFKNLKSLAVKGKSGNAGKIKIEGNLELENQEINALYQLIKQF